MTRQQMKSLAKLQIEGKIGSLFWLSVVASFLGTAAGSLPGVGFVVSFVISSAMSLGMIYVHFRIAADPIYRPKVRDLFDGFNNFWPFLKVALLTSLFTALWSLLFVIPGII